LFPLSGTRSRSTSPRTPARRAHSARHSLRSSVRRRKTPWKLLVAAVCLLIVTGLLAWATIARRMAPMSNTSQTHFDAIIVLGSPADADGNPTPIQFARVTEAVREYERGVAPRLILTGGSTRFHYVEAEVMARTARAQGIPESAIFVEDQALDTIQNACYSDKIMRQHGWTSAEVVSSDYHLPRAAMIFGQLPLEWRMHAAPSVWRWSRYRRVVTPLRETLSTVRYLAWARAMERCEP